MRQQDLFLLADAALRDVVDRITPEQLDLAVPPAWSQSPNPTLRGILAAHARDEAWLPDVLAGRTMDEVGDTYTGDLLGGDPIAAYDRLNHLATAAVQGELDPDAVAHLSYGDFPVREYLEHVTLYRTFQAWDIALLLGDKGYQLPPELVAGVTEFVLPQVDQLRAYGVFLPEVEVPEDADPQTKLLGLTGYLHS